jgi:hypothetical protein
MGAGMMRAMETVSPAEPLAYGTASAPRTGPPLVLSIVGVASVISAVLGIAFAIWYATQTYYTIPLKPPPAQTSRYVRPPEPVARRVTVEEGDAIIDGMALVVPINQPQRDIMKRITGERGPRGYRRRHRPDSDGCDHRGECE